MARKRNTFEFCFYLFETICKICTNFVHFVQINDSRHLITVCLSPNSKCLCFNSCKWTKHLNSYIQFFKIYYIPADESKIVIAPSKACKVFSTSQVKSTWPGVSIRLNLCFIQLKVIAADEIVIPIK